MSFKFDSSMYAEENNKYLKMKVLKKRESKSNITLLFDKVLDEITEAEKNNKKIEYILFSYIHYNDFMNAIYLSEYSVSQLESMKTLMIFGIPCNFSESVKKGFIVFYKKPQVDDVCSNYITNNKLTGTFYIERADDIDELNNKAEYLHCDEGDMIVVGSGVLEGKYYVSSTKPICLLRIYCDFEKNDKELRGLTKENMVWYDYNSVNYNSYGYDYNSLRPSYSTFATSSTSNITTESSVSDTSGV